jgi:hypothetical protein
MYVLVCRFEEKTDANVSVMRSPRDFGMQVRPVGSRCWFSSSLVGDGGKSHSWS